MRAATGMGVLAARDELLGVGDRALAPALAPWLEDASPVVRVTPDPECRMARACDIAVAAAVALGLDWPGAPSDATARICSDACLDGLAAMLRALPEPLVGTRR